MQVTGKAFITVKGKRLASREGASFKNFGGVERTGEMADTGVVGYSEKNLIPEIECTIVHKGDTSLKELLAIKDTTASFDTDTGKSLILINAWCAGGLELSKSEVKVKFQGLDSKEI